MHSSTEERQRSAVVPDADLVPSRRSRQRLVPVVGGPHGDFGASVAVAGHFGQAKPPVERLRAAVDREHVENQVLARALCFFQKRGDDPGTAAVFLRRGPLSR